MWRPCAENYLYRTISKQRPALIICLGKTAIMAVLGDSTRTIKNSRRKVFHHEARLRGKGRGGDHTPRIRKIPVVSTYHPAAIMRDPTKKAVVLRDFEMFKNILAGKVMEEDPSDRIYILQDHGEDLPWNYSAGHSMALDTEATGLNPYVAGHKMLCAGVSQAPLHAHAFFLGDNLATERFRDALKTRTRKIVHNAKHDYVQLRRDGFTLNGEIFCTYVAMRLLDENYPDMRLGHLCDIFTPMELFVDKFDKTKPEDMEPEELLRTVARDADGTYRLGTLFERRLKTDKLERAMHLKMRTLRTIVDVEHAGMFVDQDALDMLHVRAKKTRDQIRSWFLRHYPKSIESSKKQPTPARIVKIVYDGFGIPVTRRTDKTRKPSTDEIALKACHERASTEHQKKTIRAILQLRAWNKNLSTYIEPIRDKHGGSESSVLSRPQCSEHAGRLPLCVHLTLGRGRYDRQW
jgi:hypothetical protein